MIGKIFSIGLVSALFVGAVLSAGATVTSSYQLAKLDQREQAALVRQSFLKEELARASSLQPVLRYAQAQGFAPGAESSVLHLNPALAQR